MSISHSETFTSTVVFQVSQLQERPLLSSPHAKTADTSDKSAEKLSGPKVNRAQLTLLFRSSFFLYLVQTLQCFFFQSKPTDKQQPPSSKLSKKRSCDEVWNICEAVKKCLFVFCNLFIKVFGALGNVICSRVICAHLVWEEICQEWGGINIRSKHFD